MVKSAEPLYDVQITFHRALNLPIADISTLACDPYIEATLEVPARPPTIDHGPLKFRTPTVHRNVNPTWEAVWVVGGMPQSGFVLKMKVVDEDTRDRDDRMGKAYIQMPRSSMTEEFEITRGEFELKKRKGSFRPWIQNFVVGLLSGKTLRQRHFVVASVKVLRKTSNQKEARLYTAGPTTFVRHFSPLIGKVVHKKGDSTEQCDEVCKMQHISSSAFIATRIRFPGPVPKDLRHHWVGYRPFVVYLFKRSGLFGRLIHFALHRQYQSIYGYNKSTVYGAIDDAWAEERSMSVEEALAKEFLDITSWGDGAKLFTYVITLDGELRFTETGEDFAIDMISKHSMHADVAPVIAYSGEFFVQQIPNTDEEDVAAHEDKQPREASHDGSAGSRSPFPPPNRDPKAYELIIDNDSGTYRPKPDLLPLLQSWLSAPTRLGGLGRVRAMPESDKSLREMKTARAELKKERAARGEQPHKVTVATKGRTGSARSISSGELGSDAGSFSSGEVKAVLKQPAKSVSHASGARNGHAKTGPSTKGATNGNAEGSSL